MSASASDPELSPDDDHHSLRVQPFDRVTSFFLSLIVVIGSFVALLFLAWLAGRWEFPPRIIKPSLSESGTRNPPGLDRDFEPPGAEEIEEIVDPAFPDEIAALTDAVSTVAALPLAMNSPMAADSNSRQVGDSRPPGPDNDGRNTNAVPRHERWQIDFEAKDLKSYASQLDHFEIELGVIGGSIQGVDYIFDLVEGPKKRRVIDTKGEDRLYFMWTRDNALQRFDRILIQQAVVPQDGRHLIRFIPKSLENRLAQLELEFANKNGYQSVEKIAKTVFLSERKGSNYQFRVSSQRYRKRPAGSESNDRETK
ncbi:MAG: hypothetical protein AAGI63_19230 [Planctomycetota bacterium]